jgi:uncharacterized repeat protein (TIGR03803 family)
MKHPSTSETTRKITLLVLAATLLLVSMTASSQTYKVLYKFQNNGIDPLYPGWTGLFAQGRDGNLYSTSQSGGKGYGTVFQLTPAGKMTVLRSFKSSDGTHPSSGLTLGTDGSLYGTLTGGGTTNGGRVFKITTSGAFKVLHSFGGTEGSQPKAPPIQGTDGNFYGTTLYGKGGRSGSGMVYKMTPQGKLTVLYQFDFTHGGGPIGLIQGTDGDFYGTAEVGGTGKLGVVFKITSRGKLTVLYNFDGTKGQYPIGPIIQASDGNFYGTTQRGGTDNVGVIYKMTPSGALTTIFNFLIKDVGYATPLAGLVQGTDGKFYGGTYGGGTATYFGVLFQVTSKGKFTRLYDFKHPPTTGAHADVSLFQHTNGTFYSDTYEGGIGYGVLYSLGMKLGPFVSFVGPLSSGKVGKTIQILGQGFTGATNVSFNGVSTTFSVVSDTYLTATVPDGATNGLVTVKTPGGALTSNKVFRVTPAILSFSPTSGPVGTPVTITGTSFTGATKVTFGGVKATTFSVDSDTQITANVPTGAKTGKIAITTPGGTATSKNVFTVTQ